MKLLALKKIIIYLRIPTILLSSVNKDIHLLQKKKKNKKFFFFNNIYIKIEFFFFVLPNKKCDKNLKLDNDINYYTQS